MIRQILNIVENVALGDVFHQRLAYQEVINSPALILLPSGSEVVKPGVLYELRVERSERVYKMKF